MLLRGDSGACVLCRRVAAVIHPRNTDTFKLLRILLGHALKLVIVFVAKQLAQGFERSRKDPHYLVAIFLLFGRPPGS